MADNAEDRDELEDRKMMERVFNSRAWELYKPKMPCVDDIIEISRSDPAVNALFKQWTSGHITLEQALIEMVKNLYSRMSKLQESELYRLRTNVTARIVNDWTGMMTENGVIDRETLERVEQVKKEYPPSDDEALPDAIK